MVKPSFELIANAKRVLRYVKDTLNFGIKYKEGRNFLLEGYCDSDYGGEIGYRKSTSGVFFFLGGNLLT